MLYITGVLLWLFLTFFNFEVRKINYKHFLFTYLIRSKSLALVFSHLFSIYIWRLDLKHVYMQFCHVNLFINSIYGCQFVAIFLYYIPKHAKLVDSFGWWLYMCVWCSSVSWPFVLPTYKLCTGTSCLMKIVI